MGEGVELDHGTQGHGSRPWSWGQGHLACAATIPRRDTQRASVVECGSPLPLWQRRVGVTLPGPERRRLGGLTSSELGNAVVVHKS